MNKITSFSIRLDIPDTDLRVSDISYLIDKSLRTIIDNNKNEFNWNFDSHLISAREGYEQNKRDEKND